MRQLIELMIYLMKLHSMTTTQPFCIKSPTSVCIASTFNLASMTHKLKISGSKNKIELTAAPTVLEIKGNNNEVTLRATAIADTPPLHIAPVEATPDHTDPVVSPTDHIEPAVAAAIDLAIPAYNQQRLPGRDRRSAPYPSRPLLAIKDKDY